MGVGQSEPCDESPSPGPPVVVVPPPLGAARPAAGPAAGPGPRHLPRPRRTLRPVLRCGDGLAGGWEGGTECLEKDSVELNAVCDYVFPPQFWNRSDRADHFQEQHPGGNQTPGR